MNLKVQIKSESLLHIGSGYTYEGIYDEGVVIDETGVPFIPGTTLKGILRDSCYKILYFLSKNESYNNLAPCKPSATAEIEGRTCNSCWLCRMFGIYLHVQVIQQ